MKKIGFVLLVCVIAVSACKKSSVFSGAKIHYLNDFSPGAGYTVSYVYNDNGTIYTYTKNNGITIRYYYSGDTITAAQVNGLGQTTTSTEYYLNKSGYADSAQGQLIAQHSSSWYNYDANGQWTQVKTYLDHNLTNTDNYSNNSTKNTIEIQHVAPSGTTYDYYTYFNSNSNTIGVQNQGMYLFGVSSVNLIQTDIKIGTNLDTTDIITYRYKYDGSGNVDTLAAYHRNGTLADSMTFIYY